MILAEESNSAARDGELFGGVIGKVMVLSRD